MKEKKLKEPEFKYTKILLIKKKRKRSLWENLYYKKIKKIKKIVLGEKYTHILNRLNTTHIHTS